ncbi:Ger(x)C family spore germination protein [Alkalihalobacillus deserti]|uniref:Ger(x)C family spore germination protein n=1 Tax=Alkalihalobacillus deserti TaxID=2879466 RepID=UPI001D1580BF|nr:Ger(x)C family spore germination protein [Alkalihalobacillus deserti]
MKKLVIVLFCLLLVTGCWDRRELTEIGIVSALAIDKNPDTGDFEITSLFIRPSAESTQTPSPERPFLLVTTTGKTIIEAIRKSSQTTDREGFFAHNKVIIINEQIAKEGLIPVMDTFQRGKDIRGYVWLCIAKGTEAKNVLQIKSDNISRIPANYLNSLIENAEEEAAKINFLTYNKEALSEEKDPVAGVLSIEKIEKEPFERVKFSGGAVFQKDKLKGFLTERETRGYHFVTGEGPANQGVISLPSVLEKGKFVTIEVRNVTSQIKPEVKGNQISFTIEVKQEGRIAEQQATGQFKDRKEQVDYFRKIEEENKKRIEEEVNLVVKKAQQEFQTDIFGFGRALNKDYPDVWNNVKDNWDERFADVPYTVNANVDITSSLLLQGPLEPK